MSGSLPFILACHMYTIVCRGKSEPQPKTEVAVD